MIGIRRTDTGLLANWWWTVDRWLVVCLALMVVFGYLMSFAASPAVAQRLEIDSFHFVYRQLVFLSLSFVVAIGLSMLPPEQLRRLAFFGGVLAIGGVILTLFDGAEIKGARRWIRVFGLSVQPSEFLKPCFIVAVAWCFTLQNIRFNIPGTLLAFLLYLIVTILLVFQPDIGQMVLLSIVWGGLFYLSGRSIAAVSGFSLLGLIAGLFVFRNFPHVQSRISRFLDPSSGDTYQIDKSVEAIQNGGLLGTGLGDGKVKFILPDAHTDYVFAVAAEEGGMLVGLMIIGVFAVFVLRALWCLSQENRHWIQLAGTGLVGLIGIQAFINLGVNMNILPAKGMTLPFISYGGSSLLALSITMGMILSLTRKRFSERLAYVCEMQNADFSRQLEQGARV